MALSKPIKTKIIEDELSTEVTDEDLTDAVVDEFGVKYSKDGKRLLLGADIERYKIKEGTKAICRYAFFSCEKLQEIRIPSSVKILGENPFVGCECTVISNSPFFRVIGNVLYNADLTKLISYLSNLSEFIIPTSVTSIGDCAFARCESLQEITIPSSVTSIGDRAFEGCESLQEIKIPNSVKNIGRNPFVGCECAVISNSPFFKVIDNVLYNADLTKIIYCFSEQSRIIIPPSVINIEDYAFHGCESLQEITIPPSVASIGCHAFDGCESLKEITIPSGVISIGSHAFERCESLQEITISPNVTSIENCTFFRCRSLQEITIPPSVTSIAGSAFEGCESLQKITIPSSVTSIGDYAFYGCKSLREITIPSSVKILGKNPFVECKCTVISNSQFFKVIDNVLYNADLTTIIYCFSGQSRIIIPPSVTNIGSHAFYGCESLQEITIPSGVTSIGSHAFERCESLRGITIPSSVTHIEYFAFWKCKSLREIKIPKGSRAKFEQLLPYYKDLLVEVDSAV